MRIVDPELVKVKILECSATVNRVRQGLVISRPASAAATAAAVSAIGVARALGEVLVAELTAGGAVCALIVFAGAYVVEKHLFGEQSN